VNEDEFVKQIQYVQKRMTELRKNASQLPSPQQSRLTKALDKLSCAMRDLQVAEETIRLLLSAVQQSKDSIIITTAKLDPPGPEIVFVNPAFSQMTGYEIEEVLGKTPRLLQGPKTDRAMLDDLRKHLSEAIPFHGEAINYHKDGTEFYVEWNISPISNINKTITHFIAIQRDITARKRLEEERESLLRREQANREEAEAANRIKDEFLAMLSHELRTPLTPILGWSKLLQTNKLPEEKLQAAMVSIEEHAKRQAKLIDDLLDLARIVRGKLTLNLSTVTLILPLAAALETVRLAAEAKSIHIKTVLDATVEPVMGDTGRLQQVFWNLLSNAIKFTPEGGSIIVELQRIERYAHITVSDTGQGIHPDFLPFVFDRFRQEDSSMTRQFGGLGLGLAISRQIVEAHGGTIEVESLGVGKGTTFKIELPTIKAPPPTNPNLTTPLFVDLSNIKVLVVEDDVGTRDFITFALEQYGANVNVAGSASEAIEVLAQLKPDILLIDLGMPNINGYTLLRKIRSMKQEQGGKIPAVALTAYVGESDRQQALAAGFQMHVPKPVEPAAIAIVIAQLLGKKQ
jgi:PAS domain S-box-containing protein